MAGGVGGALAARGAVLLLLLTAGCASVPTETPVPRRQAVAPPDTTGAEPAPLATPRPAPAAAPPPEVTRPAAPAAPPAVAKTPARLAPVPAPAVRTAATPPASAAALTLNVDALKERLRNTTAIGVFTKISLKNKVDDLLEQFREYYQGTAGLTMTQLRLSYDLLMMKVLSLLQDRDQMLASSIVSSREAIWDLLSDRKTFAALQG